MRLLHCHSGNLFGGIERALLTLADVPNEKLLSDFALCFDGPLAKQLRAAQHLPTFLGPVRYRLPWTVWRARRLLAQHIAKTGPNWILTHGMWSLRLAYPVAREAGVPIALWVHDVFQGHSWLENAGRLSPDRIFANSQFTARGVPRVFSGRWPEVLPPPRFAVTPDDAARNRIRAELEATGDTVVILIAGRFEPLKGHALLFKSLARVALALPSSLRWSIWIAGEAQRPEERVLKAQLHAQAAALGTRVRFLGHRADISDLYTAADIYCQPNTGPEAYGLTFSEAAAAGLPVVTTRVGAGPEFVDDNIGRLVPPGDEVALASALTELALSPTTRQRLGAEAARRARQMPSPNAIAERLINHLEGSFVSRIAS